MDKKTRLINGKSQCRCVIIFSNIEIKVMSFFLIEKAWGWSTWVKLDRSEANCEFTKIRKRKLTVFALRRSWCSSQTREIINWQLNINDEPGFIARERWHAKFAKSSIRAWFFQFNLNGSTFRKSRFSFQVNLYYDKAIKSIFKQFKFRIFILWEFSAFSIILFRFGRQLDCWKWRAWKQQEEPFCEFWSPLL